MNIYTICSISTPLFSISLSLSSDLMNSYTSRRPFYFHHFNAYFIIHWYVYLSPSWDFISYSLNPILILYTSTSYICIISSSCLHLFFIHLSLLVYRSFALNIRRMQPHIVLEFLK